MGATVMNRYHKKLIEFLKLSKNFDVKIALQYIKNRHTLGHEEFSVYMQQHLESYFSPVIDFYKNGGIDLYPIKKCKSLESNIVWVCWWQGENSMPDVVHMCVKQIRSLCRKVPEVTFVLITKDNYSEYIELPRFTIDKLNKGIINLTSFSDILRQCLLSTYGGAWIDSTVICTSIKGIEQLFQAPYFSIKIEKEKVNRASEGQVVTSGRWAGFFLNNVGTNLFAFVRDCLLYYWEKQDYLIDFYMQNYCIKIAVDNFSEVRGMVDSQPLFCNYVYYIEECFKNGRELELKEDTYFYKLSYKIFDEKQIKQLKDYLKKKDILVD